MYRFTRIFVFVNISSTYNTVFFEKNQYIDICQCVMTVKLSHVRVYFVKVCKYSPFLRMGYINYLKYFTPDVKIGISNWPGIFLLIPAPQRSEWAILPNTRPSGL